MISALAPERLAARVAARARQAAARAGELDADPLSTWRDGPDASFARLPDDFAVDGSYL